MRERDRNSNERGGDNDTHPGIVSQPPTQVVAAVKKKKKITNNKPATPIPFAEFIFASFLNLQ